MSQEKGIEHFNQLSAFFTERELKNDWADYIKRGRLCKADIEKELEWEGNGVLKPKNGNKQCVDLFNLWSKKLITDEIINPPVVGDPKVKQEAEEKRVVALTKRNSSLEEKLRLMTAENKELKKTLEEYGLLHKHMQESGRLIRP